MALQTYSHFELPAPVGPAGASASVLTLGSNEKFGFTFQVPKTGTINKVHFTVFSISNNQTLRLSLQTVDTSTGKPTGTLYGGSAAQTMTATASTQNTVTFSTPASATAGDCVAFVLEWDSTNGSMFLAYYLRNPSYPAYYKYSSGAWGSVNAGIPNMQVEYNDGTTPHHGNLPVYTNSGSSYHSGNNPDERGLKMQFPFPARAIGFWGSFSYSGAAHFDAVLYDSGGSVIASCSLNANIIHSSGELTRLLFTAPVNLAANAVYYLTLKPTQASAQINLPQWSFSSATFRAMFPGAKTVWMVSRVDGGAWTELTSELVTLGLMLDQADDGVGGAAYSMLTGF